VRAEPPQAAAHRLLGADAGDLHHLRADVDRCRRAPVFGERERVDDGRELLYELLEARLGALEHVLCTCEVAADGAPQADREPAGHDEREGAEDHDQQLIVRALVECRAERRVEVVLLGVEGVLDVALQSRQHRANAGACATRPRAHRRALPIGDGVQRVEAREVGADRADAPLKVGVVGRGVLHDVDVALEQPAAHEDRQRTVAVLQRGDGLRHDQRLALDVGEARAHVGRALEVVRRARGLLIGAHEQELADDEEDDERDAEGDEHSPPANRRGGRRTGWRVRRHAGRSLGAAVPNHVPGRSRGSRSSCPCWRRWHCWR
jgi:hypothetical protein